MTTLATVQGCFTESGFYLRDPRSGAESVDWAKLRRSFGAIAINVGDHALADWATIRTRAEAVGIVVVPWARTRTVSDVSRLCRIARTMPARAVCVDAEAELLDGRLPTSWIVNEASGLELCVTTEPWTGELNCAELGHCELQLQLFPQETLVAAKSRELRAHAYEHGAHRVHFMLGVHGDLDPRRFPPIVPGTWIYTLDDCFYEWEQWVPKIVPPLTLPYTGPLFGPSSPKWGQSRAKSNTAKALKIALHVAGYGNYPKPDRSYNRRLEDGIRRLRRFHDKTQFGDYEATTWELVRRMPSAEVGGTFAVTAEAEALIRSEAPAR